MRRGVRSTEKEKTRLGPRGAPDWSRRLAWCRPLASCNGAQRREGIDAPGAELIIGAGWPEIDSGPGERKSRRRGVERGIAFDHQRHNAADMRGGVGSARDDLMRVVAGRGEHVDARRGNRN